MIETIDAILFLGFGAVLGLLGISHVLVPAFFGAGYEPVERLVYLMLPIIIIVGISSCLEYQYFIPTGKRALSTRYIIAGAVTNLILNLLLIPTLGAGGAVAASVAAEFLIMILYMMNCERAIDAGHVFSFSWKRVIVGIVMAITVSELGKLNTNSVVKIIIQLAVGALLYIGLLAAIKDSFIKRVLRERKR
jgi:O-antigen/teichoic acid export membrane protein